MLCGDISSSRYYYTPCSAPPLSLVITLGNRLIWSLAAITTYRRLGTVHLTGPEGNMQYIILTILFLSQDIIYLLISTLNSVTFDYNIQYIILTILFLSQDITYLLISTLNSVTFDHYAKRQCGGRVRSLTSSPTNGHCWESNPRPFNQSGWVWK